MKAASVKAGADTLLDPKAGLWAHAPPEAVTLMPTPLAMVQELSPFLAISQGHGITQSLEAVAVHNGELIAVRLRWASAKSDTTPDLNSFVDGVAVLFPTVPNASAVTMGAVGMPVNAWYWRADKTRPYEVLAEGFRFVRRLQDNAGSDLAVAAEHADGHWNVVFRRSLGARNGLVRFAVGRRSGIAVAVWAGSNAERSGRKAFSGEFMPFELA
jgi:DMSO reductase family type II enzyme heme b subunit